jgi:trimethylamine---corrinoid protein Co-methyltransferase
MSVETIRPTMRLLSDELAERIIGEARDLLADVGLEVAHDEVTELLLAHGAERAADGRIRIGGEMCDRAVESAPSSFKLYDRDGDECADLGGDRVHFVPGSAAINVLDGESGEIRPPVTADYVAYARLVDQLDAIDYQSTAFIPSDVHELISDSYRLYLSLIYGPKPVVTGAFTIEAMEVFEKLLLAVRGDEAALAEKPLAVFSCCPTAPLKWSDVTSKNVIDCARLSIPVEYISMPLTGFVAPGTLVGSIVQHTAETMSGLVISQCAKPGTPCLWGGSPAVFDYRYETTPMGAVETQMIDCACAEIGKRLGLPTQAYIALSDSKRLDAQAGMESASGALLAALSGINSCSGPGMLDFESCQSLEKLVLDNEICASAKRLVRGVELREGELPSRPHFLELLRDGHLIISDHTQRWIDHEVRLPGSVVDRANRARYFEEGAHTLEARARDRVTELLKNEPKRLDDDRAGELSAIMQSAARAVGMDGLPEHNG